MKYEINGDFKHICMLTFPLSKPLAHIAEPVLGALFKRERSDKKVTVTCCKINADGRNINALLYQPKGRENVSSAVVYYHGGGFVYKAAPYQFKLVREYCVKTPCKVLLVDYGLAYKYPYPAPFNDCFRALEWLVENSERLGIDKSKIAVAGDSAGGNLAASVAIAARDRGLVKLCGQMLVYPVIDRRMKSDSMKKYTDTPIWNGRLSEKMWRIYLPNSDGANIGYASPIEAADLSCLPNTYIEIAEFDSLHDEGVEYARALEKAGNRVFLNETKGTVHGYDMAAKSKTVIESVDKRIKFLQNIFYGGFEGDQL